MRLAIFSRHSSNDRMVKFVQWIAVFSFFDCLHIVEWDRHLRWNDGSSFSVPRNFRNFMYVTGHWKLRSASTRDAGGAIPSLLIEWSRNFTPRTPQMQFTILITRPRLSSRSESMRKCCSAISDETKMSWIRETNKSSFLKDSWISEKRYVHESLEGFGGVS